MDRVIVKLARVLKTITVEVQQSRKFMMIGKIFGEDFSRVEPKKPKNMAEITDGKGLKDISLGA